MPSTETPTLFVLESQPDWGRAALLEDNEGKLVLLFEHGGRRIFKKAHVKGLKPAELEADEAKTVDARLRGRTPPAARKTSKDKAKALAKAKAKAKPVTAAFPSFDAQVRWFETFFPGGFAGEKFISEERGSSEAKGKKGYKTAAIALARERLTPERLASSTPDEVFEVAKKLLSFTNLLFPMEGPIPFKSLKEEDRAGFLAALTGLLHGEGPHAQRLEQFADSVRISDANGKVRKVTWPLATLLQALYDPEHHTFVKPTFFERQALLFNLTADKSQAVTGAGYDTFLDVARKTSERLVAAGHQPRDLMDVYSFIWRSHAEQPAQAAA